MAQHQRGSSVPDQLTEEVISKKKKSAFPRDYDHSGWLDVRTRATKPWKRRFFVLANNFLLCGVTPHATKLEKVIPLEGSNVKTTIRTSNMTFEILRKKKRHQFRAPNTPECNNWTEKISRASKLKIKDVYQLCYVLCLLILLHYGAKFWEPATHLTAQFFDFLRVTSCCHRTLTSGPLLIGSKDTE